MLFAGKSAVDTCIYRYHQEKWRWPTKTKLEKRTINVLIWLPDRLDSHTFVLV